MGWIRGNNHERRFEGSGKEVENEAGGGDGSGTGSLTKGKTIDDHYRCQTHTALR